MLVKRLHVAAQIPASCLHHPPTGRFSVQKGAT